MGCPQRLFRFFVLLLILTIFNKSEFYSQASDGPSNLCFPPNIHLIPEEIPNDIFDINDTIDKQNNFQDPQQGLHSNKKESPKISTLEIIHDSEYSQGHENTEASKTEAYYREYYEYLLHRVVESHLSPYPNWFFQTIFEKLKFVAKGAKLRWKNEIKPKIDNTIEKGKYSTKLAFTLIFHQHLWLSTTFPYAYTSTLLIIFLATIYLRFIKPKRASSAPNISYDQEAIIQMLKRINWLCESFNNTKEQRSNTESLTHEDGLSPQLHMIHNNLKDIDSQLQDLGKFAYILTNIVQRLEQDIQSIPSRYVRPQAQPDINQSRFYTNYSDHEEFQNQILPNENDQSDVLQNSQLLENGFLV